MVDFEQLTAEQRLEFIEKETANHRRSERIKEARECLAYYKTENPDICSRKKKYVAPATVCKEGGEQGFRAVAKENKFAANEKVASSFFRDITDGKVQYLLGEGVDVNALDDTDEAHAAVSAIVDPIAQQLKRYGQHSLTDALTFRKGYTYLQVINGRIRLYPIPFMEVRPYYDRNDELEAVLRVFERGGVKYAEYHTRTKVYPFFRPKSERNKKGEWTAEPERPQIQRVTVYGDGTVEEAAEGKEWIRLPWFEMKHNNDGTTSLTNSAKSMIRCYDVTVSDFANNLIDLQDVFIHLKDGYGSGAEWDETLELMRTFKAAENVDGVTTFEVPHQARKALMDVMKADIYAALRGVDVGRISGGNLTNTAIRALYSDIDLWADQAEWHLEDWTLAILETVADYMGVQLPPVTVSMKRNVVFDEVANMDAAARQKGVLSDKTIFEHHPWVEDAQAELERVSAQELDPAYSAEV